MLQILKYGFLLLVVIFCNITTVAAEGEKSQPKQQENNKYEKDKIFIRTGIHKNYFRIVFNMSKKVEYTVNRISNALEIRLQEDFEFTSKSLHERPKYITDIRVENKPDENAMIIHIMAPQQSKIRKFWYGNSLVVDIFKPDFAINYQEDAKKQRDDPSKTKLVSKDLDKRQTRKDGAYESLAKNIIYSTKITINDDNSFMISPETETKCAVFKNADVNYIAFNKKLDEKEIKQSLSGLFKNIEFVYNNKYSILKIYSDQPFYISTKRVADNENSWLFRTTYPQVDFSMENESDEKERQKYNFEYNITSLDQPYLKINNVKGDKEIIDFNDSGYGFKVIMQEKISNPSPQYFNDLELLKSSSGLVILDKSNNIKLTSKDNNLIVTNKDQERLLTLSSPRERTKKIADVLIPKLIAQKYINQKTADFDQKETEFINQLTLVKSKRSNKIADIHLNLARLYFDNGLYFESASNFIMAIDNNPRLKNIDNLMANLSVALLLSGKFDQSSAILHAPEFITRKELNPYRVVVYNKRGDIAKNFNIRNVFEVKPLVVEIAKVPIAIKDHIKEEVVKFSLNNGFAVDDILSTLSKEEKNHIKYVYYSGLNELLHGNNLKAESFFDRTIAMYKTSNLSEIYTVPAKFQKIMIQYNTGRMDIDSAIKKLDSMRYIWLKDNERLQYLMTMNDLYEKAGYSSNIIEDTIYIKNLYPDYYESNPKLHARAKKHFKETLLANKKFNDSHDIIVFYEKFKDYFDIDNKLDKALIYENLAKAYQDLYILEKAENIYKKIIKINDKDNKIDKDYYRYKLAKVYLEMGKYKETIKIIKNLRAYDKNIEITKALANAMIEAGKFKDAKKIIKNKQFKNNEDIIHIGIKLAFESSDNILAKEMLEKLLHIQLNKNKVDPETIISLAAVLKELGDTNSLQTLKNNYQAFIKNNDQRNIFTEISTLPKIAKIDLDSIKENLDNTNTTISAIKKLAVE